MPARAELFHKKKGKILEQLNQPIDEYTDLSPKGSIDEGIRELIDYINSLPGLVSTSSCAGRVSVFLEGSKSVDHPEISLNDPRRTENEHGEGQKQIVASAGGKGGGQWLFVSHDPISEDPEASDRQQLLGVLGRSKTSGPDCMPDRTAQFVHFKFEAMVSRRSLCPIPASANSNRSCTFWPRASRTLNYCSLPRNKLVFAKAGL